MRQVPFDVPVEDTDFKAPDLVKKLSDKGVKYLIIGHVPKPKDTQLRFPSEVPPGLVVEMADLGITQKEADRLKLVARFCEYCDFPVPHESVIVVFEVQSP